MSPEGDSIVASVSWRRRRHAKLEGAYAAFSFARATTRAHSWLANIEPSGECRIMDDHQGEGGPTWTEVGLTSDS